MTYLLLWLAFGALGGLSMVILSVAFDPPDTRYVFDGYKDCLAVGAAILLGPLMLLLFVCTGTAYVQLHRRGKDSE